ncbi:hypothetical protein [Helicobacter turcicus]|uniref:Uncharacterized protein n=1 Tax=Helicobacter turcicus TaxID=2867412 RepID=A0ABS7JPE7_9HELI|nr:hypothetical protein [Helicobacter turcicus]MBX7491263.1 hypothetical protein [Helicobacter turcicus]MBX7546098.1 hypothetical protein [Helicobacter turcicus]
MHNIQRKISEASFNFDEMSDLINILNDFLSLYELEMGEVAEEFVLEKVISQYYDHTMEYGVLVSGVCPYKILAWSGYILCQKLWENNKDYAVKILSASILAMEFFLEKEGVKVNQEIQIKTIKMIKSELNGKAQLGIGMNGFYMIFRALSLANQA